MAMIESINLFVWNGSPSPTRGIKVLRVSDALFICVLSIETGTNQLHASQQQTFAPGSLPWLPEDEEFGRFDSRFGAQGRAQSAAACENTRQSMGVEVRTCLWLVFLYSIYLSYLVYPNLVRSGSGSRNWPKVNHKTKIVTRR